jgi:hypothetical protein
MKLIPKYITKSRRNIVKTLEMSDMDDYAKLAYYEGIYTVRNVVEETSDDLFFFREGQNMVSGYIDSNSDNTLSILSNRKKLVVSMVNSFYHTLLDNISEIIYALECYPKHELIIDISETKGGFDNPSEQEFLYHNVFLYFLETLKLKKIKYRLVKLKDHDIVYINNFRLVSYQFDAIQKADVVYDFFKFRFSNPKAVPHKKVFLSRSLATGRQYDAPSLTVSHDNRFDDHKKLEDLFESMGYEVVRTEELKSFQDQIDLFYEVKVLASITGSGLANAAFMQKGQTLIEIITPLVVPVGSPGKAKDITDPYYVQELHNFYKNLSYYKKHTYFGLDNDARTFEELNSIIENDPKIKNFLDRSDE